MCQSDNKKLSFFSGTCQVKSVKELTEKLKALSRQLKDDKTVIRPSTEQNFSSVISQNKMHDEKHRLNSNCSKRNKNLLQRRKNLMKVHTWMFPL